MLSTKVGSVLVIVVVAVVVELFGVTVSSDFEQLQKLTARSRHRKGVVRMIAVEFVDLCLRAPVDDQAL